MRRRVIASEERSRADAELAARDPATGARRREGFLLGAYVVLFVAGVWAVASAELGNTEPPSRGTRAVTQPTQKPSGNPP